MILSWNIPAVAGGDPAKFAAALVDAGFEGVGLKGGDGDLVFSQSSEGAWPKWGENIKAELVAALRKAGLKVYIWHFLYGGDPAGELAIADRNCTMYHPDGYIWDVESAFDGKPAADVNARLISKGLRKAHPDIAQGLCWWALPKDPQHPTNEWHPVHVAKAFAETVDCILPMMYWGGSKPVEALAYLQASLDIWSGICGLPILPVGRAYTGDGGTIEADAIAAFGQRVYEWRDSHHL
ncbi:MAG TPA: hypothetical protein VGM23_04345, partial [Armatimonadota bacterium]